LISTQNKMGIKILLEGKDMAEKNPVSKKSTAKKKPVKGQQYECAVCGLTVNVDEDCGCVDTCDIICCGEPMKETKKKAKVA
jgi:hypothetical protein